MTTSTADPAALLTRATRTLDGLAAERCVDILYIDEAPSTDINQKMA